jgi:hypothetical protein
VDEIAFQTRRNLAQRALVDILPFGAEDQRCIRRAASELARGRIPTDVSPRFLVSASRYALQRGASPLLLSQRVIAHLSRLTSGQAPIVNPLRPVAA